MHSALRAGLVYFAIVFSAGLVLGTVRVLGVTPWLGEVAAVALELPVMLFVSWISCSWLINKFSVGPHAADRLLLGGLAFAMLMIAETGVSLWGFGRTFGQHLETYGNTAAALGLAGQVLFALFPIIQVWSRGRSVKPGDSHSLISIASGQKNHEPA